MGKSFEPNRLGKLCGIPFQGTMATLAEICIELSRLMVGIELAAFGGSNDLDGLSVPTVSAVFSLDLSNLTFPRGRRWPVVIVLREELTV